MTQTLTQYKLGDLGLREVYDDLIIPGGRRSQRHAHIPADERGYETVCDDMGHSKKEKRKRFSVYPDGYMEWCGSCIRKAGHVPWPVSGHPARPALVPDGGFDVSAYNPHAVAFSVLAVSAKYDSDKPTWQVRREAVDESRGGGEVIVDFVWADHPISDVEDVKEAFLHDGGR